jgi:hypothetical protein
MRRKKMSITDAYAVKTIELYTKDGKLHDSFTIAQGREWPDVVTWGCYDARKVFVRDRKGYREATCVSAPMPVVETLNGGWSY